VSAAREGAGIARVPSWQVAAEIEAGCLQPILTEHAHSPTPVHLLFQPSRLASPKTRMLVDYLVERWRSEPFGRLPRRAERAREKD